MSKPLAYHARASATAAAALPRATRERADAVAFQPRTELGRKLWELRQRIIASGEPLLDEAQVEAEVDRRRGGVGLSER
ncbi:MAG: hypothetical protein HC897_17280 [Thermoanaerobaculia bacterium]|nr:hypothetical protein [Thermoanaerobaculia bacterium]